MNKFLIFLALLIFFLKSACAGHLGQNNTEKFSDFFLGYISGAVVHEMGHQSTADKYKIDLRWSGLSAVYSSENEFQSRDMATSGFGNEMHAVSKIFLGGKFKKDDMYVMGFLTHAILEPVYYVFRNSTYNRSDDGNDIRNYRMGGGNEDLLEGVLVLHSVTTYYRVKYNNDFPFYFDIKNGEPMFSYKISW